MLEIYYEHFQVKGAIYLRENMFAYNLSLLSTWGMKNNLHMSKINCLSDNGMNNINKYDLSM